MVQETRHLSAPERGDLSAQAVPEADVVEPRHRGGDVLVELPEDGLACRVQPQGGPGGEHVVTVVAPRRLSCCRVGYIQRERVGLQGGKHWGCQTQHTPPTDESPAR